MLCRQKSQIENYKIKIDKTKMWPIEPHKQVVLWAQGYDVTPKRKYGGTLTSKRCDAQSLPLELQAGTRRLRLVHGQDVLRRQTLGRYCKGLPSRFQRRHLKFRLFPSWTHFLSLHDLCHRTRPFFELSLTYAVYRGRLLWAILLHLILLFIIMIVVISIKLLFY